MQNKHDSRGPEALNRLNELRREVLASVESSGFSEDLFEKLALKIFHFQSEFNPVYAEFIRLLGLETSQIQSLEHVPFLPVETFQNHVVSVFGDEAVDFTCFKSSGTTGSRPSIHYVDDLSWYDRVALEGFQRWRGSEESPAMIMGLLPGYLERSDSSLVHMVREFMRAHGQDRPDDWFFLNDFEALERRLEECVQVNSHAGKPQRICVIGVTHALLRWAEHNQNRQPGWLRHATVEIIETGGMKGTGPELLREEVHNRLAKLSTEPGIRSEYGMTEMMSQAWSRGDGLFECPPWMRIRIGSLTDPGEWMDSGRQGRIHVIDLANIASCSFLATGDIGRVNSGQMFEVLGRFDHAEVRGCNLMVVGSGT